MPVTVVTWNLHGRGRPDLVAVAAHLARSGAAAVCLQEVQRRQAVELARALGWPAPVWTRKHRPLVAPAEGLAVLAPNGVVLRRPVVLSRGAPPWSHRRRVAQLAVVDGVGALANVHLAAGGDERERIVQAHRLLAEVTDEVVIAGDLNARPDGQCARVFARAGWRDACERGPGHGRWIDHVLVRGPVRRVTGVHAVAPDERAGYRRLSDHRPVGVTVDTDPGGTRR